MNNRLDHSRIFNAIKPTRLALAEMEPNQPIPGLQMLVDDFSLKDLGRGMLNHEQFCLVEALSTYEDDYEGVSEAKVHTSNLDNLVLSVSLKAYLKSKKTRHKSNLAFLTPPFSYSFPLMLAYHLILQHLAETISPNLNAKFPFGTGILIITDNIELYSHIGRTKIQNNHLWQYINTYEVKANKFKPFSFSNNQGYTMKHDGSLPWISLFRAVRHQLPENLEMTPQVIILDLLPFRHRKRAFELITWAKRFAQHVIVVAPLFDDIVYQNLKSTLESVIPVDTYTIMQLQQIFDLSDEGEQNPVTSSWSLTSSQPYLHVKDQIDIYHIKGVTSLDELVKEVERSLALTNNNDGSQILVFNKVRNLVNDMLSVPIPIELYERVREINGKPKLIDVIKATAKISAGAFDNKKLFDHLLPQLIRDVTALYELLISHPSSPRGEALLQILSKETGKKITIVVSNKYAAQELKIWIRMKTKLGAKDLEHVKVLTQDQWAVSHLNEIYLESTSIPDKVILVNPWKLKYLSSFFTHMKSSVTCIAYENEVNLYRYQINKVHSQNTHYIQDLIQGLLSIHKVDLSSLDLVKYKRTKANILPIKVNPIIPTDSNVHLEKQMIDMVFDDKVLFSMIGVNEDDEEIVELESSILSSVIEKVNEDSLALESLERISSVKIKGVFKNQDASYTWFVPTERFVKTIRDKTLDNLRPIELKPGETWVIFKQDQRRELFEIILKMSSNTMVMKWIEMNVAEWRDMVMILWRQFHRTGDFKKHTYEKILYAIQKHKGNVETIYTVANWINGDVSSVKYAENVRAVAEIIGESAYLEKWKTIHTAMRRLWNIHIKLGKVLGTIISDSATMAVNHHAPEWVDIGLDIKIPLDDILGSIQLIEIQSVETDKDYLVANTYTEIPMTEEMAQILEMKGLVSVV